MPERFKEGYLATLGIASITYEKAVEISKKLISKGELAKEKQKKFIDNLIKESRENISEMSRMLNDKMEYLAEKGGPLKDKQDKVLKDLTQKAKETGNFAGIRIKGLINEAKEKTKSVKEKIAGNDEKKLKKVLDDMDIPTREDLEEIRNKLDLLIDKIEAGRAGQQE